MKRGVVACEAKPLPSSLLVSSAPPDQPGTGDNVWSPHHSRPHVQPREPASPHNTPGGRFYVQEALLPAATQGRTLQLPRSNSRCHRHSTRKNMERGAGSPALDGPLHCLLAHLTRCTVTGPHLSASRVWPRADAVTAMTTLRGLSSVLRRAGAYLPCTHGPCSPPWVHMASPTHTPHSARLPSLHTEEAQAPAGRGRSPGPSTSKPRTGTGDAVCVGLLLACGPQETAPCRPGGRTPAPGGPGRLQRGCGEKGARGVGQAGMSEDSPAATSMLE